MDLMTMDANYQPAKLIENYDSLLWTERFNTVGDFQLTAGKDISNFMTLLPEGMPVTLRESNIVMVAETHQIDRKKNTPEKLTITGRSYESILDRRISIQSVLALTGSSSWIVNMKTPSDVAYYAIIKICVDGLVDAADIFPASKVVFPAPSDYNTSTGPLKNFTIERGQLLSTVVALLQAEAAADPSTSPATPAVVPHGIRAVRPTAAGTAVGIEIYTGVDRTATVYFDATRDLLDDGSYLFSKVGSGNVAYGVGGGMAATMFEGVSNPTGLNRRVILVDASTSGVSDSAILRNEMSIALSAAHDTAMFDGSINADLSPYIYGVHYNLGDIVKTVGDYGLVQNSRVTEYIRSEDATGVKAYPTLAAIQT